MKHSVMPTRTEPLLPKTTRIGPVHIAVTDENRALAVWRDVVGLAEIGRADGEIRLGVGSDVLIVVHPGAAGPVQQRALGLYHVAIHVPERRDMAHFLVRAIEAGIRIAPTDHLVTEAVYIWDFDGNGIEITFETPWRGRLADPDSGDYGVTTDGKPHSGREALDIEDVLKEAENDADPRAPMPEGTRIGHVHVYVNDLDEAMTFYRDAIGFGGLFVMHERGMGDVGLGYMPHAIAFNIWAGPDAQRPPEGVAGLRHFTIRVPDAQSMDALHARLKARGIKTEALPNGVAVHDPSGNRLHIELAG